MLCRLSNLSRPPAVAFQSDEAFLDWRSTGEPTVGPSDILGILWLSIWRTVRHVESLILETVSRSFPILPAQFQIGVILDTGNQGQSHLSLSSGYRAACRSYPGSRGHVSHEFMVDKCSI